MHVKTRMRLAKAVVWAACSGALAWLGWAAFTDRLGANPIEEVLHFLGSGALILLLSTLAITPIRRLTGWNRIIRLRRLVGLWAFAYLTLHFTAYVGLDQFFAFEFIFEDIAERPYITVGFTAWVILIPVAVTSTKGWIRRLGRKWQLLHRLVYVAAGLGVLHYFWKVKADTFWPLVAAITLAVSLGLRLRWWKRDRLPARSATG